MNASSDSDSISARGAPSQEDQDIQEDIVRQSFPFVAQFIYQSNDLEEIKEAMEFFVSTWVSCDPRDVPASIVSTEQFVSFFKTWKEADW